MRLIRNLQNNQHDNELLQKVCEVLFKFSMLGVIHPHYIGHINHLWDFLSIMCAVSLSVESIHSTLTTPSVIVGLSKDYNAVITDKDKIEKEKRIPVA